MEKQANRQETEKKKISKAINFGDAGNMEMSKEININIEEEGHVGIEE